MDIHLLEKFFSNFQIYRFRPGNIIRLVRYALNLTTRDFAKKTGVSQTDITRCELGQKTIPEKKLWIFLENLRTICPIEFYSSYTITRSFYDKDEYGNPTSMPGEHENFKLDLSTCFKESIFRESYIKLVLSSILYNDYQGNHFHGTGVLRYLLWAVLREIKYTFSENSVFFTNEKVISIIAFFQNMISHDRIFDKEFVEEHILTKKHDIIEKLYNHIEFPNQHAKNYNLWYIDLFMLMFYTFKIDFEKRLVAVTLYEDIQPPKNVTICWESGLIFKGSNDTCR